MKTSKHLNDMALSAAVKRCVTAGIEGRFPCGPGLSLVVTEAGRARFVHRYPWGGGYQSIWLDGCYPRDVTLGEARQQCEAHRDLLDKRINPKDARGSGVSLDPTLAEYATQVFELLATPKDIKLGLERSEWLRDMTKGVGALAGMKIDAIVTTQIRDALRCHWKNLKPTPTAKRLVMRLKSVLRHRHSTTRPDDDRWQNPADLQVLCDMLGRRPHHRKSHPSLSWRDAPAFIAQLRQNPLMSARALEWVILTGVRSNEGAGARWREIDWRGRTWTIPVERLKTEQNKPDHVAQPFVVPLSLAMVQLLRRVRENRADDLGPDDLIFPSAYRGPKTRRRGQHVDPAYKTNSLLQVAQSIVPEISVHGFRSTLVAWGAGVTHRDRDHFALDLMDRVIGHNVGSREGVGGAGLSGAIGSYAHDAGADLYLPRRKAVMREWSAYLGGRTHSPKRGPEPVKTAKESEPLPLAA